MTISLDQATMQRMQQEQAKKIFRVQVAIGVVGNEDLMKLATAHDVAEEGDPVSAGAFKAASVRDRAMDVIQDFLDTTEE
jgi:Zn finger protein HypA/HybF involved in hydrogenase expression